MAEDGNGAGARIPVTVCIALGPGRVVETALTVQEGARISGVLDEPAVRALLADGGHLAIAAQDIGVWGRRCSTTRVVEAGDRIEIYRPLRVDPMTARRERFRKQGARATGLFALPARSGRTQAD